VYGTGLSARAIEVPTLVEDPWPRTLDAPPCGLLAVDEEGRILLANARAASLLRRSHAELVGIAIEDLVPDALRDHRDVRPLRAIRGDGTEVAVEIELNPLALHGERAIVIGIADLAERVVAEDTFRLAVEVCPSGVLLVDEEGTILVANRQAARILGYPMEELTGLPVDTLVPRPARGAHASLRNAYAATPAARPLGAGRDLMAIRKDGTEVPVEVGLGPLVSRGKRLVVTTLVDISVRKEAERAVREATDRLEQRVAERTAALERSNQDLERFTVIAAHDLQEPLRMVASYTEILAEEYRGRLGDAADQYIHFATDGARRMQGLLDDLLVYSRVTFQDSNATTFVATAPVVEVLADLRLRIEEAGATVRYGELPAVHADRLQVRQLFQSLISNAIKFRGAEAPWVEVSGRVEGEHVLFVVRDNGIGFEMRHATRIFEIFQRLHTPAQYPGRGIGLAICKRIVERHGGRIWAESAPGAGAAFRFTLPHRPI